MFKLFIDPGHGGEDPGSVKNGLKEKDLTLAISKRIAEMLENYNGISVKLSRTSDKTVTLKERTDAANQWGADYFLSIHINAGGGEGFESHIYPGTYGATVANQNVIHTEIIKKTGFNDRVKRASDFHVLRESHMPAILNKNGFIDNKNDAAKLKQSSFIEKMAQGHLDGLVKAFCLKKKAVF